MVTRDELEGLNVVLNEARLGPVDVDQRSRQARIQFEGLMLDAAGLEPEDRHLTLCLTGVSRVAGSRRGGNWDDEAAPVLPLAMDGLTEVILRMQSDVYGWEFFDPSDEAWNSWRTRLSFDEHLASDPAPHVLELFQEYGHQEHLDFRIWFDDVAVQRRDEKSALQEIIDNADRWWKGMYAGDPATAVRGIYPAGPITPQTPPRQRRWPWSRGRNR